MSKPPRPNIHGEWLHPEIQVPDVQATIDYYIEKLGFDLGFTWGEPVRMAGLNLGKPQIFVTQGEANPAGCSIYFLIHGVDRLCEFHRANGVTIEVEPADREYAIRDYSIRDLWGYRLSFGQWCMTKEPALPIERVDVPVRLERSLAAVLADLAAYKRMTISECLEETLLHTFEKMPDGNVASPHTLDTFDVIKELKEKHGLDYDCHASYRFVEQES